MTHKHVLFLAKKFSISCCRKEHNRLERINKSKMVADMWCLCVNNNYVWAILMSHKKYISRRTPHMYTGISAVKCYRQWVDGLNMVNASRIQLSFTDWRSTVSYSFHQYCPIKTTDIALLPFKGRYIQDWFINSMQPQLIESLNNNIWLQTPINRLLDRCCRYCYQTWAIRTRWKQLSMSR